ncbi:MAG: amidophosphoribosyltransferase [Bacteroidales bacterium]|nr:amidophosphoribosyltransferase [Bacteroidales bacterium]MCF8332736.1 amidophosphoribosyltransferase [Bacteroidales bacterium]
MSELIKHECGIALVRLRKPLEYYLSKYGTPFYGLNKLHLLMEKQHNRGQDGAGIASLKLNMRPGQRYFHRQRSNDPSPIKTIFNDIYSKFADLQKNSPHRLRDVNWLKKHYGFTGELFLGHLRYGTFGGNDLEFLHPVMRENNWKTRNLVLAGNFNFTNVDELFDQLVDLGQFPVETSDTITVLERIGHFLDEENERLYSHYRNKGLEKIEITDRIVENIDVHRILEESARRWDGGYAIGGLLGHGDAFVMRDPSGIRPAFYYMDEEVVVAASERPVIQTAFNVPMEKIHEVKPGHALLVRPNGEVKEKPFKESTGVRPCSFERIYFSRGSDKDIYNERKSLGKYLVNDILKEVDHDFKHTVFSYIPNTASTAYYGMIDELHSFCDRIKKDQLKALQGDYSEEKLGEILSLRPRMENVAVKDAKMRTFITEDQKRDELVAHLYDVTYGIIDDGRDNLVVLDDSIVRGTTLKQSIIRILDRLNPKKIIIGSSAPQIRYPDCYGIDMAKLNDFIAFNAAIQLLKETNQQHVINEVYRRCKEDAIKPKEEMVNHVKAIYEPFTAKQISEKISELVAPPDITAEVKIVYQSIENLHKAIPHHNGDWYFTGNFPTPGGNKVVNQSFINYIEGKNERAY